MSEVTIPSVVEHRFTVEKFPSVTSNANSYLGPVQTVAHKNVALKFRLVLAADPEQPDKLFGFIEFMDGPKRELTARCNVFVSKGPQETVEKVCTRIAAFASNAKCVRLVRIPRNIETLATNGCLCGGNKLFHILVVLFIPESAFVDPDGRYRASAATELNPVCKSLFQQIRTSVDTSSPYHFDRFEFISNDDQHFYVHKNVLASRSVYFKQMFSYEKPEDAEIDDLKKGTMKLENLSAGVLNEIFCYIYLGRTTKEFYKFAMKILEVTSMYGLPGLTALCETRLVAQTKQTKDLSPLLNFLQVGCTHKLSHLKESCVTRIKSVISKEINVLEKELVSTMDLAQQHDLHDLMKTCEKKLVSQLEVLQLSTELVENTYARTAEQVIDFGSIARKYALKELTNSCAQWLAKHWNGLMAGGLNPFMEDKTNGVLPYLLGCAMTTNQRTNE